METNLPDAYALLMAEVLAIKSKMAEIDELHERLSELEDRIHEAWMGGTD